MWERSIIISRIASSSVRIAGLVRNTRTIATMIMLGIPMIIKELRVESSKIREIVQIIDKSSTSLR